jgi:uncharacterized protein
MIFETIITTQSADGVVHIAPMGIREESGLVILAPFKPSTTLDNVLTTGYAVQNFCDDVRVFAGCVTGTKRDWPTCAAIALPGVRLLISLGHSELKLTRIEDNAERPKLFCERIHTETHGPFRGFNRAQAAVIEAAVLVSRLHMLSREKIESEWQYLMIAVEKTAGPIEHEAWAWLQEKVDRYREKSDP